MLMPDRTAEAEAFSFHQIEDDRQRLAVRNAIGEVRREAFEIAVMRPWPMPSVMDEPGEANSPVV